MHLVFNVIKFQVSNKFVIPVGCLGQQKIEAASDENDVSDDVIDEAARDAANDISPSSDICMDYDSIENRQEQDEKGDGNNMNERTILGGQVLRHHTQYLHAHTHNLPFSRVIIPLSS